MTSMWRMAFTKVAPKGLLSVVETPETPGETDTAVVTVAGTPLVLAKPLILTAL